MTDKIVGTGIWSLDRGLDGGAYILFGATKLEAYNHFRAQNDLVTKLMQEHGYEFVDEDTENTLVNMTFSDFEAEVQLQAHVLHDKSANVCIIVSETGEITLDSTFLPTN